MGENNPEIEKELEVARILWTLHVEFNRLVRIVGKDQAKKLIEIIPLPF